MAKILKPRTDINTKATGKMTVGMSGARAVFGGGGAKVTGYKRTMARGGKQATIGGKKVFAKEAKSGYNMARSAGLSFKNPATGDQAAGMTARLRGIDAGTITAKAGERSFLRGVVKAIKRAGSDG